MRFAKYDGAGNDFVITEAHWPDAVGGRVASVVCPRTTGVGVDGLIQVWRLGSDRIGARFFNPDGSPYATCGNGTRCAARFALERGLVSESPLGIETADGTITARVDDDWVELEYVMGVRVVGRIGVDGPLGRAEGWLVDIGVPHFVLPLDAPPEDSIDDVCRRIRHDPALGPDGANVNLVHLASRNRGSIRSFERGVEGETLACGSGAMASVFALHGAGLCDPAVSLHVRGGCDLRIDVEAEPGPDDTRRVRLAGPAVHRFDGEFPELRLPPGCC